MTTRYADIYGAKLNRSPWLLGFPIDFPPEKTASVIESLFNRLQAYGQARGRQVNISYEKVANKNGTRIVGATITSEDGVIEGSVTYSHGFGGSHSAGMRPRAPRLVARFSFKSQDEGDAEEYLGLRKAIVDEERFYY